MGVSALQYIRELYPKSHITYGIPRWIAPLYQHLNLPCDQIIEIQLKKGKDWISLWKKIRQISPDLIFELHQSGRTKKFFDLYSLFYGIPYNAHNHHQGHATELYHHPQVLPLIQRDLDLPWAFGHREETLLTRPLFKNYPPILTLKNPVEKKSNIIFGIVATRETKKWPLPFFHELANLLHQKYPHLSIVIPLSKNQEDQKMKREFLAMGDLSGVSFLEEPIDQLPLKLASAQFYIGNDTGLKHLAVALNLPTFTFFGPEPPTEWHPYSLDKHRYYYRHPLKCRTQTHHYCGLHRCSSMICLNEFYPSDLITLLESFRPFSPLIKS